MSVFTSTGGWEGHSQILSQLDGSWKAPPLFCALTVAPWRGPVTRGRGTEIVWGGGKRRRAGTHAVGVSAWPGLAWGRSDAQ